MYSILKLGLYKELYINLPFADLNIKLQNDFGFFKLLCSHRKGLRNCLNFIDLFNWEITVLAILDTQDFVKLAMNLKIARSLNEVNDFILN